MEKLPVFKEGMLSVCKGDITIVFYQTEEGGKYSFFIKDNLELTQKVLASVEKKKVKAGEFYFTVEAILKLVKSNELKPIPVVQDLTPKRTVINFDYMSLLNKKCQQMYGEGIRTTPAYTIGESHCPVVTVEVCLPDGKTVIGMGPNKKVAKQLAAKEALKFLGWL